MDANKLLAGFTESDLPRRGVELKIHKMEYPFLLQQVFGRGFRKGEDDHIIENYIFNLVFEYIERWRLLDTKNDDEKNRRAAFNFQRETDLRLVIEKVYTELDYYASIKMPVGNSVLCLKRYGDILGFKMMGNNENPNDMHVKGTKILENMCNEQPRPQLYIDEFIHSIECIIPLLRESGVNNSVTVDFLEINKKLIEACPYFSWFLDEEFVSNIVEAYKRPSDYNGRLEIGSIIKSPVVITGELVHHKGKESQESPQWRKGNTEKVSDGTYCFAEGRDLCLSIMVACPFSKHANFMRTVSADAEVSQMQDDLRKAGRGLYVQLLAMMDSCYYS